MEGDTGSVVSIIFETAYNKVFKDLKVKSTNLQLRTYSGDQLPMLREIPVSVK